MATSQAEKKQANRATDAGVNYYLIKPFGPLELTYAIHTVFETRDRNDKKEKLGPESQKMERFVSLLAISPLLIMLFWAFYNI
ncbi:MAG: hypothetical protein OMM_12189 [Candidatus Magnetoglobus multicellularis str. Araruama]|uniref:Response regulatory domain-containing protein n=1 Tax=Candidatus Magnetoglobus multicellularis str. Araruama TaxID=890399 RepID=A0A1V1NWD4_9BACT|nr:MAG: hypothetical protein OMM_12189 [Candidatus Magnetoglobus multicellularis str. Araruama]